MNAVQLLLDTDYVYKTSRIAEHSPIPFVRFHKHNRYPLPNSFATQLNGYNTYHASVIQQFLLVVWLDLDYGG